MKLRRLLVGVVLLASAVNVLAAPEPKRPFNLRQPAKTGVAVAGGAYVGYKLGKVAGKFPKLLFGDLEYGEWRRLSKDQGLLCRTDSDCNWIDNNLDCTPQQLTLDIDQRWFKGDVIRIIGQCSCTKGLVMDTEELKCLSPGGLTVVVIAAIVIGIIAVIVMLIIAAFVFWKFFRK